MAMKPLDGTFAKNALKWGVGGLWIDGGRIGNETHIVHGKDPGHFQPGSGTTKKDYREVSGRWPANVVFTHHPGCVLRGMKRVKGAPHLGQNNPDLVKQYDGGSFGGGKVTPGSGYADKDGFEAVEDWVCHPDCPVRELDKQSGEIPPGEWMRTDGARPFENDGRPTGASEWKKADDSGGASRFFLCSKDMMGLIEWLRVLVTQPGDNVIFDPFTGIIVRDGKMEVGPFEIGKVHQADCLEAMRQMPDACVTAIVCDPPYALTASKRGSTPGSVAASNDVFARVKAGGFMGQEWDAMIPGVPYWKEALRICKPGAPLLAFGGTRTHHRLMCAIEDAGWEIRDCLMWVFGSGFPKSLDISKAIDKAKGVEREVVGQYVMPSDSTAPGYEPSQGLGYGSGLEGGRGRPITAPATDAAKQWEGWGTALKPAWEPIVLAMKPCEGTFAENALRHGVAGVCIDGARISVSDSDDIHAKNPHTVGGFGHSEAQVYRGGGSGSPDYDASKGRWPANVVLQHHPECVRVGERRVRGHRGYPNGPGGDHPAEYRKQRGNAVTFRPSCKADNEPWKGHSDPDGMETVEDWVCHPECPIRLLDEQGGESTSSGGGGSREHGAAPGGIYGEYGSKDYPANVGKGDFWGSSRFFYCAKASKEERGPGNSHPTVKPLDLMKWLVTLVKMPENNLVLDLFAGSGTTGLACEILKIPFIGFDKEKKWVEVSNRRIRSVTYGDVSVKEYKAGQKSLFEDME